MRRRTTGFRTLSLRWKILGPTLFALVTLSLVLLFSFDVRMRAALDEELEKRARAIAVSLANNLEFQVFSADADGLRLAATSTLRDLDDVSYVVFRNSGGTPLADARAPGVELTAPAVVPADGRSAVVTRIERSTGTTLEVDVPVFVDQRDAQDEAGLFDPTAPAAAPRRTRVGLVQIGFRDDALLAHVASTRTAAFGVGLIAMLAFALGMLVVVRRLTEPLERLSGAAKGIAEGDLAQRVEVEGNDEIAGLATSFATMADSLRTTLGDLGSAAVEVDREAANILSVASRQTATSAEQTQAISEASETMQSFAQTSKDATARADELVSGADTSEADSSDGLRVLEEAIGGMRSLDEQVKTIAMSMADLSIRSQQIGNIMATVKDLAEQSHLLALNASVEAARAGEHGRGFTVVALEMRSLAEQSRQAALEVRGILSEIQRGTRVAVTATEEGAKRAFAASELAQSASSSIGSLAQVIRDSSQTARQIAQYTRQQTHGVESMGETIAELSAAMSDSLKDTRNIERVATELATLSKRLTTLVGRWKAVGPVGRSTT